MPTLAAAGIIASIIAAAGSTGLAIDQAVTRPGAPAAPNTEGAQKLAQQKAAFLSSQAGANAPVLGTSGLTGPGSAIGATPQAKPNQTDLNSLLKMINPAGTPSANFSGGTGSSGGPTVSNGLTSFTG